MLVRECMTADPIKVHPESDPLAALGLCKSARIRRLPVVAEGKLIGIITETDIFKQFVEVLGGQTEAMRLTVEVADTPGELAKVINVIAALRGNICSVVLTPGVEPRTRSVTLWIQDIDRDTLINVIQALPDVQLVRVWSTPGAE